MIAHLIDVLGDEHFEAALELANQYNSVDECLEAFFVCPVSLEQSSRLLMHLTDREIPTILRDQKHKGQRQQSPF